MSQEFAVLARKVDLSLAKQDLILARLDDLGRVGKPGMTQRAFAKLIGCAPRTVARMVKTKRIRIEKGRVPHAEAKRFLS